MQETEPGCFHILINRNFPDFLNSGLLLLDFGRRQVKGARKYFRSWGLIPVSVQMVVFVAAGFSLRRTGEMPVPPRKVGRKILDWSQLGINGKNKEKERLGPITGMPPFSRPWGSKEKPGSCFHK